MMKTSNETRTENTSVITRKDLRKILWKSLPFEISWNYVRQDHMGFAYSMTPVIEKLYQTKEERQRRCKDTWSSLISPYIFPRLFLVS